MHMRRATVNDEPVLVEMAMESVTRYGLPLEPDLVGIAVMVRTVVGGNPNFAMVMEHDGRIVGAVGALVHEGFWFRRKQADVVMFYAREKNAGLPLLREFARWVRERPVIKLALISVEFNADPRIVKLLRRLGFTTEFPQLAYVRKA